MSRSIVIIIIVIMFLSCWRSLIYALLRSLIWCVRYLLLLIIDLFRRSLMNWKSAVKRIGDRILKGFRNDFR